MHAAIGEIEDDVPIPESVRFKPKKAINSGLQKCGSGKAGLLRNDVADFDYPSGGLQS